MTIDKFSGDHHFLSNFYPCLVKLDGVRYASVEHAYQAAKTMDKKERKKFHGIKANAAKKLGRQVKIRSDWESVKISVMKELLVQKFSDGHLRQLLLDTGDSQLVEGNDWSDTFWGKCGNKGHNHLGRLLMEVRTECKK